jgi:hypothetical protein
MSVRTRGNTRKWKDRVRASVVDLLETRIVPISAEKAAPERPATMIAVMRAPARA